MIAAAVLAMLCACSPSGKNHLRDETQHLSPRVIKTGDPVPKGGGVFKIGKPYFAGGKWYTPAHNEAYDQVGLASWYGDFFHGRQTANGEVYDMYALTAAHPTLPMPVFAKVTNLRNKRSVIVRVNDRGPYKDDRIIDLSRRAAEQLGFYNKGLAPVRVQYYGRAPMDGDDSLEQSVLVRQPWAARIEQNNGSRTQAASLLANSAAASAGVASENTGFTTASIASPSDAEWSAAYQAETFAAPQWDVFGLGR